MKKAICFAVILLSYCVSLSQNSKFHFYYVNPLPQPQTNPPSQIAYPFNPSNEEIIPDIKVPDRWQLTSENYLIHNAMWNNATEAGSENIDITKTFCIEFKILLSDYNNDAGADGIAFVLRNPINSFDDDKNPLTDNNDDDAGRKGGNIGYIGIINSFAIEFDTFYNQEFSDITADHLAYHEWNKSISQYLGTIERIISNKINVEDGNWLNVKLVCNPVLDGGIIKNEIITYVNDFNEANFRKKEIVDLRTLLNLGSNNFVRWGFTSATQDHMNVHKVQMISLKRNGCCDVDLTITHIDAQTVNFDYNSFAGPLKVCKGSTVTLKAVSPTGSQPTSIEWKENGTIINTPPLTETIQVSPSIPTTYSVSVIFDDDPTCIAEDQVTIIPYDFKIDIAPRKELCANEAVELFANSATINGISYSESNNEITTQLSDPTQDEWITWEWKEFIDPYSVPTFIVAGDLHSQKITVNPGNSVFNFASYELTATLHSRFNSSKNDEFVMTCEAPAKTVVVSKQINAEAIITKPVCNNCVGELDVKLYDKYGMPIPNPIGATYEWNVVLALDPGDYFSPSGRTSTGKLANIILPPSVESTVYQVKVTYNGCVTYDKITVKRQNFEITSVEGKGLCTSGTPQQFTVYHTECGSGPYRYTWNKEGGNTGAFVNDINAGESVKSVQILLPGSYTVTVQNESGCAVTKTFNVINKNFHCSPKIIRSLCFNANSEPAILGVDVFNGKLPYKYEWYNSLNTKISTDDNNSNYSTSDEGRYYVIVTDADGCVSNCTVDLKKNDEHIVGHPDYGVCEGASVQLKTKIAGREGGGDEWTIQTGNGEYVYWTPTEGLDNPVNNLTPVATPNRTMTYTAHFVNSSGCESSFACNVYVKSTNSSFLKYTIPNYYLPQEETAPKIFNINGLSEDKERTYNSTSDLNCGYLLYGYYYDGACSHPIPQASMMLFNNDGSQSNNSEMLYESLNNSLPENIYNLQFSRIIPVYSPTYSTQYVVDLNANWGVQEKSHYFGSGIYGGNLFFTLLDKSGNILRSTFIQGDNPTSYTFFALQDLRYQMNNVFLVTCQNSYLVLYKINPNDLSINWAKKYSIKQSTIPTSIIQDRIGNIIVIGHTNDPNKKYKSFAIKINPNDGNIITSRIYFHNTKDDQTDENTPNIILNSKNKLIIAGGYNSAKGIIYSLNENLEVDPFSVTSFQPNSPLVTPFQIKSADLSQNSILDLQFVYGPEAVAFIKWDMDNRLITSKIGKLFEKIYNDQDFPDLAVYYPQSLYNYSYNGICQFSTINIRNNQYGTYPFNSSTTYGVFLKTHINDNANNSECFFEPSITEDNFTFKSDLIQTAVTNFDHLEIPNRTLHKNDYDIIDIVDKCNISRPCNCSPDNIEINIIQEETITPGECCFTFEFTPSNEFSCSVNKFKIRGDQIYTIDNNNLQHNVTYSKTVCFAEFSGIKTLYIDLLNNDGKVICTTTKDIRCKCSCETDPQYFDNVEVTFESTPGQTTPDQCCYDVYLDNKNDCAYSGEPIRIKYAEGLDPAIVGFTPDPETGLTSDEVENTLTLTMGTKKILGGSKVKLGTICAERTNSPKTISLLLENGGCNKQFDFDLGCQKSCCEYIDELITFVSEEQNDPKKCCFRMTFSVSESTKCLEGDIELLLKINGVVYSSTSVSLQNGTNSVVFCISTSDLKNLSDPLAFTVDFAGGDGEVICSRALPEIPKCIDCCDKITLTADPNPMTYNGIECCYRFNLNLADGLEACGGVGSISITDEAGNNVPNNASWQSLTAGDNFISLCISPSAFNGQNSLKLKIKINNNQGQELCVKEAEVNSCSVPIQPCTPDFVSIPWISKHGQVSFTCMNMPPGSPPCIVDFDFVYRYILDQNGTEFRDVQITKYNVSPGCACADKDEILRMILRTICNDGDVKSTFKINLNNGGCYDNYRIISSDCWIELTPGVHQKCNSDVCCYIVYEVCYGFNSSGQHVERGTMLYKSTYTPVGCPWIGGFPNSRPCMPNNCQSYRDTVVFCDNPYESHPSQKYGIDDQIREPIMDNGVCIQQITDDGQLHLLIEGKEKGLVDLKVYNLLGQKVESFNFVKSDLPYGNTISLDLQTGVYVCEVLLNNKLYCKTKIRIIK